MCSKLMYLVTFYSDNLCFKWRFEQETLSGNICQKWEGLCPYGKTGRHVTKREVISSDGES